MNKLSISHTNWTFAKWAFTVVCTLFFATRNKDLRQFPGPENRFCKTPDTKAESLSAHPLEIDCGSVQSRIAAGEDFLLPDCRERDEFAIASLPQAVLLPLSEIEGRVGEIEKFRQWEMVVYCHHGMRSMRVVSWLRQLGFDTAQSMAAGIDGWAVQIDPMLPRY